MVVMFGFTSALAEWTGTTVYHSDGVMAIIMTNQWKSIHVNLYGMPVSLTDFHPFRLLTGVHLKSYGL